MDDAYKLLDENVVDASPSVRDNPFAFSNLNLRKPLPKKVVENRALKASIADNGFTKPNELVPIMDSQEGEDSFRAKMAEKEHNDNLQAKQDMINTISQQEGPMDPLKAQMLLYASEKELKAGKLDDIALEKRYAENGMALLYANARNDLYLKDLERNAPKVNAYQDAVSKLTIKTQAAQKLFEDNNNWEAAGGVTGYAWDFVEQFVPGLSWWHRFDKEEYGISPGENMMSQVQQYWTMDPEAAIPWLKARYETISSYNKQDAQDWLHGVLTYSRNDATWDNAMTAIDIASSVPVGGAGKLLKAGAKAAEKGVVDPLLAASAERAGKLAKLRAELYPIENKLQEKALFKRSRDDIMRRDFLRAQIKALEAEERDGLKETMTAVGKALNKKEVDPVEALSTTGNVEEAAKVAVAQEIRDVPPEAVGHVDDAQKLRNKLLSMWNPGSWVGGSTHLGGEAIRRILESMTSARGSLAKILNNPNQALRLSEEALAVAFEKARAKAKTMYVNADNSIMDIGWRQIRQEDGPNQINAIVMPLGDTAANPFNTAEEAIQVADHLYKIPDKAYEVVKLPKGYAIEVTVPVDETDASVLSSLVQTNDQTPRSMWNTFLGWVRTPEDLLSPSQRQARNIVMPLAQETARLFKEAFAPTLNKLSKEQTSRMSRLMKVNRDFQEGDVRGRFFETVADYEQTYHDLFKSWPTEDETAAYMMMREMSDFDWAIRSLTIKRDKSINGVVRVTYKPVHTVPPTTLGEGIDALAGDGKTVGFDTAFDGKRIDALPEAKKGADPAVFIVTEDANETTGWSLLSKVNRKEVERLVKEEGYRIYQNADVTAKPFAHLRDGDQAASFIILKGAQERALDITEQLPYKAGFHVEYPVGFYTKMPNFYIDKAGRRVHGGDTSLLFHATEAEAKKYTAKMEAARKLLEAGDEPALRQYLINNLPHKYEDFVRLFSGNGGKDVHTPLFYTKTGQTTREAGKQHMGHLNSIFDGAIDLQDSEYNLMNSVQRKFAQEKNIELPSIREGSEGKPVFAYRGSHTVDPLATMNRAMHQMIRMYVYDNYQKQAVSAFIQEFANPASFGGSVTKRSIDSIMRNPISFLLDPMWEDGVLDKSKLAAAKNVHRSIVQLLGMPSMLSRNMDWVNQKIMNTVFEKLGPDSAEKVGDFLHTKLSDPAKYARSIAFHTKLGLFNPVQLFLQGQSIVHAAAITGNLGRSYKAGAAASLMRLLSLTDNDAVIKGFAKKAKFFGWNETEFEESFRAMRDAGIWNVEGDVASLDDMTSAQLFTSKGKRFLDKGTVFFKEGERFVRLNAFNTAYLEWKAANPAAKLDARAMGKLLTRYDDLALNMTRKSTAAFQQGIFSLPTQFSTYQIHLMEQVLGKRLTKGEKARALVMYSGLYGLPVGATAAFPFVDFGGDIKKAAMERGIDTNDGAIDWLVNGIMANVLELATGKETNIGERYGPSQLTFIKDLFSGEKAPIELLGGPGGQVSADILGGLWDSTVPLLGWLVTSDPSRGNDTFPLMMEDFIADARNISSLSNAYKFYAAANVGKYISKNEIYQADATAFDGFLSAVFGLDPRAISESYLTLESVKAAKDAKYESINELTKLFKRAISNKDDAGRYMKLAQVLAVRSGLTARDWQRAIRDALKGLDTSFVEGMNEQWIRSAPVADQWKRREFINDKEGK